MIKIYRNSLLIFCFILLAIPLRAQLYINEFQASNITTKVDPGVNYRQWIEIYNGGNQSQDLYGYYLSDQEGEPGQFRISEHISVSSRGVVILWLDQEAKDFGEFKLDMDGGELLLVSPGGEISDQISYSRQYLDISFGRESNGSSDLCYFRDPSPGQANRSKGFQDQTLADSVFFSLAGGFYSGSQYVSLSTPSTSGVIRYTKDGSWPGESSPVYYSPIHISKSGVIRARVYEEDLLPGEVGTNTYFINEESTLPVVSISTDPKNFFSGDRGIHVVGYRGISGWCSPDPVNWNRDWERPVNFEYYTREGEQVVNQLAGTKILGGCSRFNTFKSLALYARKRYGDNSFSFPFFSTKEYDDFKGLVLRNSGNDGYYSMIRDGFMQSLIMGEVDIDYLAYQPANVFVNGEYWGILNLREKINEHYVATNYSVDPDEVDMLETEAYFDWGKVIKGSGESYEELINFVEQNDMALESNFDLVSGLMDVEEFLNYYLVDIYYQNEDWPQNNIKYWRYHGEGGKWRWILYDTDFGWGLFPQSGNSLNWATRGASDDRLIRALLENENFKNEFIQRMSGFMNTVFHPLRANAILDSISTMVGKEIPRHTQKWGRPGAVEYDYQTKRKMPRWAETRPDSMRIFMRYKFGIPGLVTLSSSVNDAGKGSVHAAGVKLPDQFSGLYFKDVPVRMHAVPKAGYTFSHWEGASGSSSSTIFLGCNTDHNIKAVFQAADKLENIFLNELGASNTHTLNDEYGQSDDWIEIYNGNDFDVDLAGCYLSESRGCTEAYQFPFEKPEKTRVPARAYRLLWCDGESSQGALHTNFKLSKEGESVFLIQKLAEEENMLDSITYSEQYTDISFGRNPEVEGWDYLLPTPGAANLLSGSAVLHINELMTKNNGCILDEYGEADDWIELYNPTDDSIDIGGMFLSDSIPDPLKYQIPTGDVTTIIPPGGYKLLWADGQEDQGVLHLGFKLDSRSEQVSLYKIGAGVIDSLSYEKEYVDAPMGCLPDGSENFQYVSASPGLANEVRPLNGIFINEFLASNSNFAVDEHGDYDDWIEIYNDNDYPIDLGGIFLSDSLGEPAKHQIPMGIPDSTTIPPKGYLLFWADGEEEEGVRHLGFKLNSRSEQIGLYQLEAGMIDSLSYQVEHADVSSGRLPDGSSNIRYLSASPGSENCFKSAEGLVINEFMSSNLSSLRDEYGEYDDWIELYNGNDYSLDLGGLYMSDSLGDPTKFRFPWGVPDSTTIPAHGHLVVWADGSESQGVRHLGFKLKSKSEQICIYQAGAGFIDSLSYVQEHPDLVLGRLPDGQGDLQFLSSTPGSINRVNRLSGLHINEFQARNTRTLRDEFGEFDDWIEIFNDNDFEVDLGGTFITDSLGNSAKYRIPSRAPDSTTIAPGGYLILWADNQNEQGVLHLDFSLNGDGEQIGLVQADGQEFIDSLSYASIHPDQALGILLEYPDSIQYVTASPGLPNYLKATELLYISEMMASGNEAHSDEYGEYDDWIEIHNNNDHAVNIGGYYLTDSLQYLQKYHIPTHAPDSTTIGAGSFLVFWADNQPGQGVRHLNFRLSANGEGLALSASSGREVVDSLSFPNQYKHFSYSREGNTGEWKHMPPTFGEANEVAPLSGIYINEFMASNRNIPDDHGEFEDWIEIYNANEQEVNLGGLYLTDSIGEPTKYRIPSHTPSMTTIDPHGYLILYADDQKEQGVNHMNFRLKREGEHIALIHYDEHTVLDSLTYSKQFSNASTSLMPGDGSWLSIPPSPGAENILPDISQLVINEVMGYNRAVVEDNHGEYENWVELYNRADFPVNVGGLFFTDSLADPYKFRLSSEYPDSTTIEPYGFLTLWADNTSDQGILHLGFGIAKTGEEVGVFDYRGQLLDSIYYPFISPDISWGRLPDGYDAWTRFPEPSPSQSNVLTRISHAGSRQEEPKIYPNPVREAASFEIPVKKAGKIRIEIVNAHGAIVSIINSYAYQAGNKIIPWEAKDASGSPLTPGLYMFKLVSGERSHSGKFILH